jgi:hypothetical protein
MYGYMHVVPTVYLPPPDTLCTRVISSVVEPEP